MPKLYLPFVRRCAFGYPRLLAAAFVSLPALSLAQGAAPQAPCIESMPGMRMCAQQNNAAAKPMTGDDGMAAMMENMHPHTFLEEIEHHATSGTSAEPNSTPVPMLMTMRGRTMLMFHANAFLADTQQTSERGGDKLFSTNWLMPMAERRLGPGQLTLRAMLSLEPVTIAGRRYPLLFQQGETAFGVPIVDGQHPHNFFMELAVLYDWHLGERTLFSFYFAPMGDPAIGPTAYPHRQSAAENPVAALGHHQEDSTHISDDVVIVGLTHRIARIEASGFHGQEPDEHRWHLEQGAIDSWSTRLTLQPGQNWSGQVSYARLANLEALFPGQSQARTTASVMYNRPFRDGNLASTALWGRTRSLADNSKENSYLFETTVRFAVGNYAWTRIENAGRSSELLNGEQPLPANFAEEPVGHVQAYTFGYDHDLPPLPELLPHLRAALGAQVTTYGVANQLKPLYGTNPVGFVVSLRLRPFSGQDR